MSIKDLFIVVTIVSLLKSVSLRLAIATTHKLCHWETAGKTLRQCNTVVKWRWMKLTWYLIQNTG